jgi:hypothetical protein
MIQKKHLSVIAGYIKDDMEDCDMDILEATHNYLDHIPYLAKEIEMICEYMKLDKNVFLKYARTPEDIAAFNEQFECGVI